MLKKKELTFSHLLELTNMNVYQFSQTFEIPERTCYNWNSSINKPPLYLLKLLEYRILTDNTIQTVIKKKDL